MFGTGCHVPECRRVQRDRNITVQKWQLKNGQCTCSFLAFLRSNPFPIPSAPPLLPPALPVPSAAALPAPPHLALPLSLGRLPPDNALLMPVPTLLSNNSGDLAPIAPPPTQNSFQVARRWCKKLAGEPVGVVAAAAHDDIDLAAVAAAAAAEGVLDLRPLLLVLVLYRVDGVLANPEGRVAAVAADRSAAESGSRQQQEKAYKGRHGLIVEARAPPREPICRLVSLHTLSVISAPSGECAGGYEHRIPGCAALLYHFPQKITALAVSYHSVGEPAYRPSDP